MQFEQAGEFIVSKLRSQLPPYLIYHDVNHTLDVYQAAKRLAENEHIGDEDMQLLLTAAWYHDSGFLNTKISHETTSCRIVAETLPGFGYSAADIETICGIIMATRIPQTPSNHLGEILADADLDYLGRDDFFEISDKLFRELGNTTGLTSEDEWNRMQVSFLQQHNYFTKSACAWRQAKKEFNLQQIKAKLT